MDNQEFSDDLSLTEEMTLNELAILDTTKSMGPDNAHPRLLRETRNDLAETICNLMPTSCDAGETPNDWKCANITVIHKKDDKNDSNNYIPVNLT